MNSYETHNSWVEQGSYSSYCQELFDPDSTWDECHSFPGDSRAWFTRNYTYIDYPNQYQVAELAFEAGNQNDSRLVHYEYLVASLSMLDDAYGTRRYNRWYIYHDELSNQESVRYYFDSLNPSFEKLSDEEKEEARKFITKYNLNEPTDIDMLELGWVLDALIQSRKRND